MAASLRTILRQREVSAMLDAATLTGGWPNSEERCEEAQRQVRRAMYKAALEQITDQERDHILEILRPHCPEIFCPGPTGEDEQPECQPGDDERSLPRLSSAGRVD